MKIFNQVNLSTLVDKLYKPNTFIRNLFFKEEVYEDSGYVTSLEVEIPHIKEKILITRKIMGENLILASTGLVIHENYNIKEEVKKILQSELESLLDRIVWSQEYLCSLAFTEGKIDIQNENISLNVDFKIPVENVQEASVEWQSETANIIEDIEKLVQTVYDTSGLISDSLIIGHEAFSYMMRNKKFQKIYNDQRKFEMWSNRLQELPDGASHAMTLFVVGANLQFYQYTQHIIDDNGTKKYLIDPKKIYIGSTQAQNTFTRGRVTDIHGGDSKIFAKTWLSEDPSGIYLLAESCSMPVLSQPNAFGRMTVIAE